MKYKITVLVMLMLLVGSMIGCSTKTNEDNDNKTLTELDIQNTEYVNGEWNVDVPENHDVDSKMLDEFYTEISGMDIISVLMVKDGSIISRYTKEGVLPDDIYLNSVTKSVTSALIGIAIDKGLIEGVDVKITEYFPQLIESDDPIKKEITIRDLLTLTSGIYWPEWSTWNLGFGDWLESDNWVDFVLERNMDSIPGTIFNYSTGDAHLLSAILQQAAGETAQEFAKEVLFEPLGIKSVEWFEDPQGVTTGGFGIFMTAEDAARFGQLYLNNGKWGDKQIISADWIDESTKEHSMGSSYFSPYGYLWWVDIINGYETFYAMGFGGQYIFVVPELNLVTVFISNLQGYETPDVLYHFIDLMSMIG